LLLGAARAAAVLASRGVEAGEARRGADAGGRRWCAGSEKADDDVVVVEVRLPAGPPRVKYDEGWAFLVESSRAAAGTTTTDDDDVVVAWRRAPSIGTGRSFSLTFVYGKVQGSNRGARARVGAAGESSG